MGEYREIFKRAKGFAHADSDDMNQAGTGINVLTREQLEKGQFAGAGIRTKRQELSGEQMQKMDQIGAQTREQDQMLDEISKGLDELKDLAEKMSDVSGRACRRRRVRWPGGVKRRAGGILNGSSEYAAYMYTPSLSPAPRPAGVAIARQNAQRP